MVTRPSRANPFAVGATLDQVAIRDNGARVLFVATTVEHMSNQMPFGFGSGDHDPSEGGSDDLTAQMPLFAELQKMMSWSGGPVNWDLARQGVDMGGQGAGGIAVLPGPGGQQRALAEELAALLHVRDGHLALLQPHQQLVVSRPRLAQQKRLAK